MRAPTAGVVRALGAVLAVALAGCAAAPPPRAAPGVTPRRPASVQAAGITGPVSILIDRNGIPHISAASEADLAFGLGYMHARDRRFQMELLRMDAAGRLRELLGSRVPPAVLRLELFSRALGFSRGAQAVLETLPEADRLLLTAYADGVNLGTRREPRPFEFRLLDYTPEPWSPRDTLAVLELISFGFCKDWEQELARLEIIVYQLRRGRTIGHALGVWPPRMDFPPHLIGHRPAADPFASIPAIAPELAAYLQHRYAGESFSARPREAPREHPAPEHPAPDPLSSALDLRFLSNNWAVDGAWTGTGRSAFAVDPHVPSSLPPLPYLAALQLRAASGEAYRVLGASFPGLPAIPFGTNGRVAWGPTSNWADVTDVFVEKEAQDRPGYYETESGEQPFTRREETLAIRSGTSFTEERRTIRSTRHGVIVNDFLDRLPADFPLVALARAQTYGRSLESLSRLYRASTVSEARDALAGSTALVGNWVLADAEGGIAYTGPVNLPLRRRSLGTVPVPGWNGRYEWDSFVSPSDLPTVENPPRHFIATANNEVVQPESAGYPLNFEGDVPFRIRRINARLALGRSGSDIVGQMRVLQADGEDNSFESTRALIERGVTPLADSADPLLAAAARVLLDWDGTVDPDSAAPTLYESLLTTLMSTLLEPEMSAATLGFLRFYFNSDPLLFGVLGNADNPAWADHRALTGEDEAATVAAAFRLSVAALAKRYGRHLSAWTWRRAAPVTFAHPLGSIPGFGFLNRGGFAPRGAATSVWMHKYDRRDPSRLPVLYGPGLRLVVDFNDLSRCFLSIPGGQSGRPASRHYGDLLPLFERGDGVTVDFTVDPGPGDAEARFLFVPPAL